VANGQYGYVTTEDAYEHGVNPVQLRLMHHRGTLDRIAYGLYRYPVVPTTDLDQYMEAILWTRTLAVLCHETALDLHELCDVNPARIHLTVPSGYRVRRDVPAMYELHRRDLDPVDVTLYEGIPTVTVRRTILDGIEANIGDHLINQAVEIAKRRGLLSPADLKAITLAREARAPLQPGRSHPVLHHGVMERI